MFNSLKTTNHEGVKRPSFSYYSNCRRHCMSPRDDKMCSQKKKEKGQSPYYAFTTTVCAARSPIRCLLSDVHIRIAPSKNGIMNGIASMISSKERTSASTW